MPFITTGRHLFDVDLGLSDIREVLSDLSAKRFTGKAYGYAETEDGVFGFTVLFKDGVIVAAEVISEDRTRLLGRNAIVKLVSSRILSGMMGVSEASLPEVEMDIAFNPESVVRTSEIAGQVETRSSSGVAGGKVEAEASGKDVKTTRRVVNMGGDEAKSLTQNRIGTLEPLSMPQMPHHEAEIEITKAERIERSWKIRVKLKYGGIKEYSGSKRIPEYLLFIDDLWEFRKIQNTGNTSNGLCNRELCLARLVNGGNKLLVLKGNELLGFFEKKGFKYVPSEPVEMVSPSEIEIATPSIGEFESLLDLCSKVREEPLPSLAEIKIIVNTRKHKEFATRVRDLAKLMISYRNTLFMVKHRKKNQVIVAGDGSTVYIPEGVDSLYYLDYPISIDVYLPT